MDVDCVSDVAVDDDHDVETSHHVCYDDDHLENLYNQNVHGVLGDLCVLYVLYVLYVLCALYVLDVLCDLDDDLCGLVDDLYDPDNLCDDLYYGMNGSCSPSDL